MGQPLTRSRAHALRFLLRAFDDAKGTERPVREFAVELRDCRLARIFLTDLRWLISHNYAEHLIDITPAGARQRRFHRTDRLSFAKKSCFMLTAEGVELARPSSQRHHSDTTSTHDLSPQKQSQAPRWDNDSRELWLDSTLIKRFRVQAQNQERILATFEEEGWPTHIDDPLPPNGETECKRRLHDAICKLNKHQQQPLLHFRGDGSGRGVCWQIKEPR